MRARELGEAKIMAKSQELQGRLDEVFRKRLAAQAATRENVETGLAVAETAAKAAGAGAYGAA